MKILFLFILGLSHICGDESFIVTVPLSIFGQPFFVSVPTNTIDHKPQVEELLTPELLSTLPNICGEFDGDDNKDCWLNEIVWQVESYLVAEELSTGIEGKYWVFNAFYRGRFYANEANRMVQKVVAQNRELEQAAINALRLAVNENAAFDRPFAAAAHTLAELLYGAGEVGEAASVLRASMLDLPGSALCLSEAVERGPLPSPGSVEWAKAVLAAPLEVVVVATKRVPELADLEASAGSYFFPPLLFPQHFFVWLNEFFNQPCAHVDLLRHLCCLFYLTLFIFTSIFHFMKRVQECVFFTLATISTSNRAIIISIAVFGVNIRVLGLGKQWRGFGLKIIEYARYLETTADDTLVLFIDA